MICVSVLGYLLLLGQVNIRQFESKLTLQSQKALLQLARAKQQHCSDLFDLLSQQLRQTADTLNSPWHFSGEPDSVPGLVASLWGPTVSSFDRVDAQGDVLHRYLDGGSAKAPSYASLMAAFRQGGPALDEEFVIMDVSSEPPCILMLYPLSEGTTFQGALAIRVPVEHLLKRFNEKTLAQEIKICLADGEGRILASGWDAVSLPSRIGGQEVQARSMLDDVRHRREGLGVFSDDSQERPAAREFLAGYWPLERLDSAWSIVAVQDDSGIKTAVAEHARNIQLGMVCLFLAVFLIWLLYYRNARRRILYEQHIAMEKAMKELHYLSVQNRQTQQQLEQQLVLYRGLLNAVPMALYWKDGDGRLVGCNTEYAALTGLKRMEDGLPLAQTEMPESRQDGLPLDMEVMNKDIELLFLPQTYSKNGLSQSYLASKIAVKDDKGKVCGLLGGLLNQNLLKAAQDRSPGVSPINPWVTEAVSTPETAMDQETSRMQEPSERAEHQQAGEAARILIVDDIEENRMLLEVILSKLGYTPIQCSGGQLAVQLCRQEKYDLVLMDIQMPDMNGLEAAKQIRADSLNPTIPIIAMTASDRKDDEMTALGSGCDDYMTKPINRRLLEQKIWRNLAKMRQIREAELGHEIVSFLEGDPDYHKTIETFVGNLPSRIEEMRQALDANNLKELAFKVHALKGLGGFAGFSVYTEKAARIEDSLRLQDMDKIQQQIDEMIQMCVRTTIKSDKGTE